MSTLISNVRNQRKSIEIRNNFEIDFRPSVAALIASHLGLLTNSYLLTPSILNFTKIISPAAVKRMVLMFNHAKLED